MLHALRSGAHTRVMKNKTCRELYRYQIIKSRTAGASTEDLARAFEFSTATIHRILRPCKDMKAELAFKSRPTKIKGIWINCISGVRRIRKGWGRIDLKVKLHTKAILVRAWIHYILLSGFNDLQHVIQAIEAGDKPP